MSDNRVSRRLFVAGLTLTGAALATSSLVDSTVLATPPAGMIAIGKVTDFTDGDTKRVSLPDGSSIYVTRNGDSFRALSAKCTHKGCDVLWVPDRKIFQCPCHGGQYNAAGVNIAGPPPSPLPTRETKVDAGIVYVAS